MYSPIALADEIIVVDADNIWNLTLENATDIGRLIGEPSVMVVKYADGISYKPLDKATEIGGGGIQCNSHQICRFHHTIQDNPATYNL